MSDAFDRVERVLARGFCESFEDHKAILEVARRTTGNASVNDVELSPSMQIHLKVSKELLASARK